MKLGTCISCNKDILKVEAPIYFVVVNGKLESVCKLCFENRFSKYSNKRCEVCGKKEKQNYPYFFKKDNQLSLVCRECHNRVYGVSTDD